MSTTMDQIHNIRDMFYQLRTFLKSHLRPALTGKRSKNMWIWRTLTDFLS